MKSNTIISVVVILSLAFVVSMSLVVFGNQEASTTGQILDEVTGEVVGPWENTLVPYELIVSDEFTGADVDATVKVYDEQPEDWGNPRGDFDEAQLYTVYTASSGVVDVNKEYPGMYYAVMTYSNYNTEFVTFTIPNGVGRGDLSDYSSSPDAVPAEMTQVGNITEEDFAFTLVNKTSAEIDDELSLDVADDTEFRGWKVIVNDEEGFSLDTDGDGTYDEGISKYVVTVQGESYTIFDPSKGIDEFDSNDEYTFLIEGLEVADGDKLYVGVEIEAITEDGTTVAANDEKWSEGEGVLSYIKVYDLEGTLKATTDVTA